MTRKSELYDLVSTLHHRGFTSTVVIAQLLGLSDEYVRAVLADLGIRRVSWTTKDAYRLPPNILERLESWKNPTQGQAKEPRAA
jgi:hypothetical protein